MSEDLALIMQMLTLVKEETLGYRPTGEVFQ